MSVLLDLRAVLPEQDSILGEAVGRQMSAMRHEPPLSSDTSTGPLQGRSGFAPSRRGGAADSSARLVMSSWVNNWWIIA